MMQVRPFIISAGLSGHDTAPAASVTCRTKLFSCRHPIFVMQINKVGSQLDKYQLGERWVLTEGNIAMRHYLEKRDIRTGKNKPTPAQQVLHNQIVKILPPVAGGCHHLRKFQLTQEACTVKALHVIGNPALHLLRALLSRQELQRKSLTLRFQCAGGDTQNGQDPEGIVSDADDGSVSEEEGDLGQATGPKVTVKGQERASYRVPASFNPASAFPHLDMSSELAAEESVLPSFVWRWLQLRKEVGLLIDKLSM